jgi:hypothetical protein
MASSEQDQKDAEARAREAAEQAALPYKWTQTIKDVDISVEVDGNLKGRDFDVVLKKTKLKVGIKGKEPFIDVRRTTPRRTASGGGQMLTRI